MFISTGEHKMAADLTRNDTVKTEQQSASGAIQVHKVPQWFTNGQRLALRNINIERT